MSLRYAKLKCSIVHKGGCEPSGEREPHPATEGAQYTNCVCCYGLRPALALAKGETEAAIRRLVKAKGKSVNDTAATTNTKRPRLTDAQRLARLDEQRARLIARQKNSSRQLDARQKIIVGATVINAMAQDEELRHRVSALLDAEVRRPQDREAIAPWLSAT